MSEEVFEAVQEPFMNPRDIMKMVQNEVAGTYECNRGPRPSGAMILTVGRTPIIGRVKPCTDGAISCLEEDCMMEHDHCVRNLHAEVDAIVSAARTGVSTRGAHIFSINKPCYNCTMHIIAAGIVQVWYAYAVYDEERTHEIIEAAGLKCNHVPIDWA